MYITIISTALLIILVVVASAYDLKWRRIPNFITLSMVGSGFLLNLLGKGWLGFKFSVVGFLIGGMVFLLLYAIGGMGAGDVKLMSGVGSILGVEKIFEAIIFTFIVGGIIAIFKISYDFFCRKKETRKRDNKNNLNQINGKKTIPYGVAIAIGTLITLLIK